MTAICQACAAPARDAFLCRVCTTELRDWLRALAEGPQVQAVGGRTKSGGKWYIERRTPGLLANLDDVVLRRTRIGTGGGGHRKRGDEISAPFEPDTDNGRRTRQADASALLDAVRNSLSTIVRDLTESRGVLCPKTDIEGAARFLAANMSAIAADEAAGVWHAEIRSYIRRIERCIDRPMGRKWLGECPTWNEHTQQSCGVSLWAPEDAPQVRCHRCRCAHDPSRLKLLLFNDLERKKVPWEKILQANKSQPENRQVPERTLQSWRRSGKNGEDPKLKIRGYRRPNGRVVGSRHSEEDVPLYLWPDVRKLRDAKPQRLPTGSAAHQRNAPCVNTPI